MNSVDSLSVEWAPVLAGPVSSDSEVLEMTHGFPQTSASLRGHRRLDRPLPSRPRRKRGSDFDGDSHGED